MQNQFFKPIWDKKSIAEFFTKFRNIFDGMAEQSAWDLATVIPKTHNL